MAESTKEAKTKRSRRLKPVQTVRERTEKSNAIPKKKRRLQRAGSAVTKPFARIWKIVKAVLRPFRFLLWPFQTKVVRAVGRVLSKVLLINYFIESWREVRQVTWPNRRETAQLTFAVFAFATVFGIIITIVDYGLDKLFKQILLQ